MCKWTFFRLYVPFVCVFALLVLTGPASASRRTAPPAPSPFPAPKIVMPDETYDAGESLRVGSREIRLLRSKQKVAVVHGATAGIQAAAALDGIRVGDRRYRAERYIGKPRLTVLVTRGFGSLDDQAHSMERLQDQTADGDVLPVYVHEDSGLEMIPTGMIAVRLKAGYASPALVPIGRPRGIRIHQRVRGTTDQFILDAPVSSAEEIFALCEALRDEPAIAWAEPDFISQAVRNVVEPNDPFFSSEQWYLRDIRAPEAWETVTGSDQVIVAVMDDGVDILHEDLRDALPANTGEIAGNGLDDDGNGWTDDVNGWDFHDDDDDPRPGYFFDTHGTQVAGVVAATGDNGKGVAGCAYGCRLMPLKVLRGDLREADVDVYNPAIVEALYYAAGRTADGKGRWRGADVISISLGFSETNLINAALDYAVEHGRDGKGCPTFCASGNGASGWMQHSIWGFQSGTYNFRWELARDGKGDGGENTVWLDSVSWPGGEVEPLAQVGLPAGWMTGGDARWVTVPSDGVNHVMGGWEDPAELSLRPQPVGHWGRSYLDVTRSVEDGDLTFWVWGSLEQSFASLVGSYVGAFVDYYPFSPLLTRHVKTQYICLREELGWDRLTPAPVRDLTFMEFHIVEAPTERIDKLTIRLKHIAGGRTKYDKTEWEDAGWTTVFESTNVPLITGTSFRTENNLATNLLRFNFERPFTYDPNYNLAVDISMSESNWMADGAFCVASFTDQTRSIIGENLAMEPDEGDPVHWTDKQGNAWRQESVPLTWFGSGDEMRFFVDGLLYAKVSGDTVPTPQVGYPASHPSTTAVGANTDFDLRCDYSQHGPDLDFVAPSNGGVESIRTTDVTGTRGVNAGDYTGSFGGTSAATPLASGVAALMLSRNPDLTADQIRALMRQTCQKIGLDPYDADGRNDEYGYGRIDAAAAVDAAAP